MNDSQRDLQYSYPVEYPFQSKSLSSVEMSLSDLLELTMSPSIILITSKDVGYGGDTGGNEKASAHNRTKAAFREPPDTTYQHMRSL